MKHVLICCLLLLSSGIVHGANARFTKIEASAFEFLEGLRNGVGNTVTGGLCIAGGLLLNNGSKAGTAAAGITGTYVSGIVSSLCAARDLIKNARQKDYPRFSQSAAGQFVGSLLVIYALHAVMNELEQKVKEREVIYFDRL